MNKFIWYTVTILCIGYVVLNYKNPDSQKIVENKLTNCPVALIEEFEEVESSLVELEIGAICSLGTPVDEWKADRILEESVFMSSRVIEIVAKLDFLEKELVNLKPCSVKEDLEKEIILCRKSIISLLIKSHSEDIKELHGLTVK